MCVHAWYSRHLRADGPPSGLSTNPVLVILGVLLILAWKNAGYIGLDYFLLPMLGTPWKQKDPAPQAAPAPRTPAVAIR